MIVVIVIGFPIALVLAWAYEVKPEEPREAEKAPIPAIDTPESEQRKSIVVLPFDNMSPEAGDAYFADGLTEEIITNLSYIHSLRVISRNSAMVLKGTHKSTQAIAAELDVQYVLEGSVRKAGTDLRITAQLIDAESDEHLWAEKYDGVLGDVFGMQEQVSESIADALKLTLTSAERNAFAERPVEDVQAYDCYLRARHEIYHLTKEALERALRTLQNGLDLFPDNALLTATLGEAYLWHFDLGIITDETILDKAEEFARRSLSINPRLAQGRKLLGLLERARGSLIESCRQLKAAYDTDPNDPGIVVNTAAALEAYAGRPVVAAPIWKHLLEIDPLTSINWLFAGLGKLIEGDPMEALLMLQRSEALDPDFPHTRFWIAYVTAANGETNAAIEVLDATIDAGLPDPIGPLALFLRHVLASDEEAALAALDEDTRRYAWADPDFSYLMPGFFALINRTEDALEWLQHAVDRDFFNYPYLAETGPFLENLRGEERFQEMLEEVKQKWEYFEV